MQNRGETKWLYQAGLIHGCQGNEKMRRHLLVTVGNDGNKEKEKLPETLYVYDARKKNEKSKAYVSMLKHGKNYREYACGYLYAYHLC